MVFFTSPEGTDVSETPLVGVVIPYYQREPGILARALRSVAAQREVSKVRVVVVDDSSPISAESEVAEIAPTFPFALQVILQPNAGPGAARNRAIRELIDVRYIAFLDSDDEWCDDHLRRALFALGQGFDVYFSDFHQPGVSVSAFRRAGRIAPEQHLGLGGMPDLYAYQGDMIEQVLTGNVIGTPTVVYDRQRFYALTFRPEYRNAGEDYLFWIELARMNARFAFSTRSEVSCGYGVNVYVSSGWGTEQHFLRLHNEMRYRKAVLNELALDRVLRARVRRDVSRLRQAMARDILHRMANRNTVPLDWARAHGRLDPLTYVTLPLYAACLVAAMIRPKAKNSR